MFENVEFGFRTFIRGSILGVEMVGVVIILVSAMKALFGLIKGRRDCRIIMGEGVATALSFLLGGEVMKTIIAPDWQDIGMTCAILLMRAAMSLLIHWETKNERAAEAALTEGTGGADIGK